MKYVPSYSIMLHILYKYRSNTYYHWPVRGNYHWIDRHADGGMAQYTRVSSILICQQRDQHVDHHGHGEVRLDYHAIGHWLRSSIVANLVTALLIVTVLIGLYLSIDRMGQPEELVPIIKPEMKLYGAGISTLVSRIVMLLIFVGVFVFKDKYAIY